MINKISREKDYKYSYIARRNPLGIQTNDLKLVNYRYIFLLATTNNTSEGQQLEYYFKLVKGDSYLIHLFF